MQLTRLIVPRATPDGYGNSPNRVVETTPMGVPAGADPNSASRVRPDAHRGVAPMNLVVDRITLAPVIASPLSGEAEGARQ